MKGVLVFTSARVGRDVSGVVVYCKYGNITVPLRVLPASIKKLRTLLGRKVGRTEQESNRHPSS